MAGDKTFVDTNIIIYAYDISAGKKHEIAKDLLVSLWKSGLGVLSTQVLQEFFAAVTRKLPRPLEPASAKEIISDLLTWEIISHDGQSILEAIDIHVKHGYSFWDSLILESAGRSGASVLLSEDLSSNQVIHGVTIRNPFLVEQKNSK